MSTIDEALDALIDKKVEEKLEQKLPEIIRALGLREADPAVEVGELVNALEVAKLLNCDVSTPKKARRSQLYVYTLARQNLIPSVRISPRRIQFDLNKVRKVIAEGGKAEPYSRSA